MAQRYTQATFELIGFVSKVETTEKVTYLTIGANYDYKNEKGDWVENPYFNRVTIFNSFKSVAEKAQGLKTGDHVLVRGKIRDVVKETEAGDAWFSEKTADYLGLLIAKSAVKEK